MASRAARVLSVEVRDFRGYESDRAELTDGLTVIAGPNGAGKTNLLEAVYFGCTGLSFRTSTDRDLVRFGASTTRVVVRTLADDGTHELAVGFSPGAPKRMSVDGSAVARLLDVPGRPLLSVFAPDRLELVKGVPAVRRSHLDGFVTALWPARTATRRAYVETLGQRNSLLQRIRSGRADADSLQAWDEQLARYGIALMADRRSAVVQLTDRFPSFADRLGLGAGATLTYRPRSRAVDHAALVAELEQRRGIDLDRGFTTHGPHRDDLLMTLDGRDLRAFGSQGQQRLGLLSLLLSERDALGDVRLDPPIMLLDDVMSELDTDRRRALADLLRSGPGQAVITTTDLDHVPDSRAAGTGRLLIRSGSVLSEVRAAWPTRVDPHARSASRSTASGRRVLRRRRSPTCRWSGARLWARWSNSKQHPCWSAPAS